MDDRLLLDRGLMIGSTILPGMVDYSGLVHMNFRGTSPLRRIPNSASLRWVGSVLSPVDRVVVQREIIFTSIECSWCWEHGMFTLVCHKHSVMSQNIGRCWEPSGAGGVGKRWLPWLWSAFWLVTFPLWLGDNLFCNLNPPLRRHQHSCLMLSHLRSIFPSKVVDVIAFLVAEAARRRILSRLIYGFWIRIALFWSLALCCRVVCISMGGGAAWMGRGRRSLVCPFR